MRRHVPRRPRARFLRSKIRDMANNSDNTGLRPSAALEELLSGYRESAKPEDPFLTIPSLFIERPKLRDALVTQTSTVQDETVELCLPLLAGEGRSPFDFNPNGMPFLEREQHIQYLRDSLLEERPKQWTAGDSTRPFMVYWALIGLYLLGEDLSEFEDAVIATLAPMQNRDGGFGGGHGQSSHCATSYAAVLSLVAIGGTKGLQLIDRLAMWRWLTKLKEPDGSFRVCEKGEIDVRGAYCALTIIALLDLPWDLPANSPARLHEDDNLLTRLPEWLAKCQTYEGGVASSPNSEAHGAYAFCGLAALSILADPRTSFNALDTSNLIQWLSARQYAPEGGFSGRTNKLVDGCYSFWVGGCWPLLEGALEGINEICSHVGLARYILSCCQDEDGGLRDKPDKNPDAYHSCYVLAGLSILQHRYKLADEQQSTAMLPAAFNWEAVEHEDDLFDENTTLKRLHPVFAIPWGLAEEAIVFLQQA